MGGRECCLAHGGHSRCEVMVRKGGDGDGGGGKGWEKSVCVCEFYLFMSFVWLRVPVKTGLLSVFKFPKSLETEDRTAVAVFDGPGNFRSSAVLVQSSLGLFPVLGLDFQALV
jgi:hypothetical protein